MYNSVWYYSLNLPPLTPPAWIFASVWTVLYTTIFISLILFIVKSSNKSKILGYILFFGQLALNFLWAPVFFGMHNIKSAFIILIFMAILVLFNIKEFYRISKMSAYFLIPYFIWMLFATYLNMRILILN